MRPAAPICSRSWRSVALALLVFGLAACGSSSSPPPARPTGAPAPLLTFSGTIKAPDDDIRSADFRWSKPTLAINLSWDCRHAQAPASFDLRAEQLLPSGPPVEYFTRGLTSAASGHAIARLDIGANSAQHPTGDYYLEVLESSPGCSWRAEVPKP